MQQNLEEPAEVLSDIYPHGLICAVAAQVNRLKLFLGGYMKLEGVPMTTEISYGQLAMQLIMVR